MEKENLSEEEKQQELQRYYSLAVAAIAYAIETLPEEHRRGQNNLQDYLLDAIAQAGVLRDKKRLPKLKSWFRDFCETPRETGDLGFNLYIFKKTGYRVDIFKSYFARIERIIEKGKITTERQYYEVDRMVDYLCQTEPVDQEKIDVLNKLLGAYKPGRHNL
jgi:hypothetical protein